MSVSNNGYVLTSTGTGTAWTAPPTKNKTLFKSKVMFEDELGDTTDMSRAAKMFMWWMRTYHPELEQQFDAVEDTKRGIK